MKRTVLESYRRLSPGKPCRSAWTNARNTVGIDCLFCDFSEERKEQAEFAENCGAVTYRKNPRTGELTEISVEEMFSDRYVVETTDIRGGKVRHRFGTLADARKAVDTLKSGHTGWTAMVPRTVQ